MAKKSEATPEDEALIRWVKESLGKAGRTQSELARHLGIPTSRMSELMHGRRGIKATELQQISIFTAQPIPHSIRPSDASGLQGVQVVGQIGAQWQESAAAYGQERMIGGAQIGTFPPELQVAYDCGMTLAEADIRSGDTVIGARIEHVPALKKGALVVVERTMAGLSNYALARVRDPSKPTVEVLTSPMQAKHEIEVVALVIGTLRPLV